MKKMLLGACLLCGVAFGAKANVVTINNTTNWQYGIALFDVSGTQVGGFSIGVYSSGAIDLGSVNAAYGRVTIGLSGGMPTPDDMVTVGHFTTGYPVFASSVNVYSWLGGGPFSSYWNQPGPLPVTNVTLTIL